jgi:hypothetical protein
MASEQNVHPSWEQVSDTRWVQQYGFQDAFYGRILGQVGEPALFMVSAQMKFSFATHGDNIVDQLRNAWKQMRLACPIIGTVSQQNERIYEVITSSDDLESWAQETFKVEPDLTGSELWRQTTKARLPTMYYLPKSSELSLQAEHSHFDGRGLIMFWNQFASLLVNPKPLDLGGQLAKLPGTSDDYLPVQEEYPGRGTEIALELLQLLDVSPPETAVTYPLRDPSTLSFEKPSVINGRAAHKLSSVNATTVLAACKAHSISLTAAFHAAIGFATRDVQRQRGLAPGSKFAAFSNLDLRPYFQHDGSATSAAAKTRTLIGNFHTILPCISHYGHNKSFVDVARELSGSYRQRLDAQPGLFSALRPMMQLVGDDFTKGPLQDTTPAISTGGNLDLVLKSPYVGAAGTFTIDDFWAGDVVTGPWMDCFVFVWKGKVGLSCNFNEVFYEEEEALNFLARAAEHMLEGLGLTQEPVAKM